MIFIITKSALLRALEQNTQLISYIWYWMPHRHIMSRNTHQLLVMNPTYQHTD